MGQDIDQDELSRHTVDDAALLLSCLRGLPFRVREDMQWGPLLGLSEAHGVLAFVYRSFREQQVEAPEFFSAAVQAQRESAERYAQELERLLKEFTRREIEVIPLKGPALAEALYGDVATRSCDDLDLLVRRKDISRAERLLFDLAFSARPEADDYHRKFLRDGMMIELHFGVASPRSFPFDLDGVWSRARHERFRDAPMLAMSDQDLVLFLCLHGLKHGFSRLIWILDIAHALTKIPKGSFEELAQRARRQGLEQPLLIACEIVGEALPEQFLSEMETVIAASPEAREKARQVVAQLFAEHAGANNDPEIWGLYLQTETGVLRRWLRRFSFLTPTVEDYAWAERRGIHRKLAPIFRPFRLLRKYGPTRVRQILFPPGA